MYADNIRAAHEGLLEKQLVFGTISYGFAGEPIDGETTRRGRPRRRLVVDPVTSVVVGRVFVWYVTDQLTIDEIIRRLNDDPTILLPPRCTSGMWTRLAVTAGCRRATLSRKQVTPPTYVQIANEAKAHWDDGLAVIEIGRRLGCSDLTARRAIAYWHRSQGLPVPTAKDRRDQVMNRAKQLYDLAWEIKAIAAEPSVSAGRRAANRLFLSH